MATLPGINARIIPRRYEETRPVLIQDFSHRKIIDLGNAIHRQTLNVCEKEKRATVKEYVAAAKAKGEAQKQAALEAQLKTLAAQYDRTTRRLEHKHEKVLQERTLEVETRMTRWGQGEVAKESAAGEARLQEAVLKTEQRCHQELLEAVAKARKEEQEKAADIAAQVANEHAQLLKETVEAAAADTCRALQSLEEEKDAECDAAVATAREDEKSKAKEILKQTRDMYEQQIEDCKLQLRQREEDIARLKQELVDLGVVRSGVEVELMATREEFQKFIDNTRPFVDGQAEYALPPVQSIVFT